MVQFNEHGQPVGEAMPTGWHAPPAPEAVVLQGRLTRCEPLDPRRHARGLWEVMSRYSHDADWTYLPYGPFGGKADFDRFIEASAAASGSVSFAFSDLDNGALFGWGSYLAIRPDSGALEIGSLLVLPHARRSPASSEAFHLMIRNAFELGYRRCEWKCDSLNAASRRAAERLGFTFEGIFRKAIVFKGRNRDTAWYAIIDHDWPLIEKGHRAWLDPANFDASGQQLRSMGALISEHCR